MGYLLSERAVSELDSARAELTKVLPPQADKILRALQHVELALQYSTIEGRGDEALDASRNALRALNLIEKRREMPAYVNFAVSQAVCDLAKIVKAARLDRGTPAPSSGKPRAVCYRGRDRRVTDLFAEDYLGPRRRSDDTVDALECLNENQLESAELGSLPARP